MTAPRPAALSGNVLGIAAMLAAMAAFVANDTCVKLIGDTLPLGQLITLRNLAATLYILGFAALFGGMTLPVRPQTRLLCWRMAAEFFSTIFFLSGLIALPIAEATAIGQFTPLAITAAAAIFLKEHIGWRRWLASACGLMGVLLVIKPGTAAFSPAALLILAAVAFIVLRDLTTRAISADVPTLTLTAMSASVSILSGLVLWPFETWIMPSATQFVLLALAAAFLTIAYALMVIAMRNGDVATVSPFRYAVIVFAILSGWMIWHELPDPTQVSGIAVLTAAGLYTFHRERLASALR
ncbi:MAG: DMT family transporter [Hyphomicrobium sp.]|nr:DMT family transporter [Hyphomicrobium sp.]